MCTKGTQRMGSTPSLNSATTSFKTSAASLKSGLPLSSPMSPPIENNLLDMLDPLFCARANSLSYTFLAT